jgi:UDP-2,4-diacetamido-2,4,6-trideoxy-beta-L-altropyranose hydrolase
MQISRGSGKGFPKQGVIFRVDGGGYGVAMGHVYRCLRLAKELREHKVNCMFCVRTNPTVRSLIVSEGFLVFQLEDLPGYATDSADHAVCVLAKQMHAVLYVDLRGAKRGLVEMARSGRLPIVVYDDVYEEGLLPCVLINPSECDRANYAGGGVEYMLGSRYIILDPRIRSYRKHRHAVSVSEIFVCLGGADPCNVTARAVRGILASGYAGRISVGLGPGYQSMDEMRSLAGETSSVFLYQGVNFLSPLMSRADVAITSGGTLMCEAIALALPVLVLPTIEHEVAIAETYKGEGLIASISCNVNSVEDELLVLAIDRFIGSAVGRAELYSAQAADNRFIGCVAITRKLCQLIASHYSRQGF